MESCLVLEKFQKLCNFVLTTQSHESIQSRASSRKLTQKLLRLSGESGTQSRKRRRNFQKPGFWGLSRLRLATVSWVEALVARFTQNAWRLPLQLTREWNFQSQKTLRQIFQNFSHEFLATCIGDLFATHSSREKRVFCTMKVIFRSIFKNFSIFPRILWLFIVLSIPLPHKLTVFTPKSSIFFSISSPIFKNKVWVFLFS